MTWLSAGLACCALLGALLLSQPRLVAAEDSSITVSTVSASFYRNPNDTSTFDITPSSAVAFTMNVLNINFNPPAGTVRCTNNTGVDVKTRPFTMVVPEPNGSCRTEVAEGNGLRAGEGELHSFHAVFTGNFAVSQAGRVTFRFFSDDGWILSIAPNTFGAQPTFVSGPLLDPPSAGPLTHFPVVGSYNVPSSPAPNTLIVDFPAPGDFRFELDYTECCTGELALTLTANGEPIRNTVQPTALPTPLLTPVATGPAPSPSPTAVTPSTTTPSGNAGPVVAVLAVVGLLALGVADNFRRTYL